MRRLAERLPRNRSDSSSSGCTDLCWSTSPCSRPSSPSCTTPLVVRLVTLAIATLVTWRLNRAFTFARSNRRQHDEAVRYAIVTALAQGASYAVFAALVLTVFAWLPQAALMSGAVIGAFVSYNGHRLFAFAPQRPATAVDPASHGGHRA